MRESKCMEHFEEMGRSKRAKSLSSNEKVDYECTQAKTRTGRVTKVCLDKANQSSLGSGAFAQVYKTKYKQKSGESGVVALKESSSDLLPLKEEISLMSKLSHPNIIGLKFSFQNGKSWFVGMEFMEGGDLYHFIKDNYKRKDGAGIGVFCELFGYQIFRGLAYLHSKKIVHRDLKPENTLVSGETGALKLIDFGCSKKLREGQRDTYRVGTKEFRAPELLLHTLDSTPPLDAWSAGVIMTEMGCGKPIFGEGPTDDWDQYLRVVEFLGEPTEREEEEMGSRKRTSRSMVDLFKRGNCCKEIAKKGRSKRRTSSKASSKPIKDVSSHLTSRSAVHDVSAFTDLVSGILVYSPKKRTHCLDALAHDFFQRVRSPAEFDLSLPNGKPLPKLTDFTDEEISFMSKSVKKILLADRKKKR